MAGGMWTSQNKTLPGVYINYKSTGANPSVIGDRGAVGLPLSLPWMPEGKVIPLTSAQAAEVALMLGKEALPLKEAAKNASTIYLYRLNTGEKATAALGELLATARYTGAYGNRLKVSVEAAVGQNGSFDVITWLDGAEADRQRVASISALTANEWVVFSSGGQGGSLAANAGVALTGGSDGTVTVAQHTAALGALEAYPMDALGCVSSDSDVQALYIAYAKRMVEEEGKYLQTVVADSAGADHEAVISVKNGVVLEDGVVVNKETAVAYVAGATAACPLTGSLTNTAYIGAADVTDRYTTAQQIECAKAGQMVFLPPDPGQQSVTIQKDINTLITYTNDKTYALSKNKVVRTLYAVAAAITQIANRYYKGKVPNNEDGRSRLKAQVLEYIRSLGSQGVLRDVSPEDITITQGELLDSVVISYVIRAVDVMETFYNTITVES